MRVTRFLLRLRREYRDQTHFFQKFASYQVLRRRILAQNWLREQYRVRRYQDGLGALTLYQGGRVLLGITPTFRCGIWLISKDARLVPGRLYLQCSPLWRFVRRNRSLIGRRLDLNIGIWTGRRVAIIVSGIWYTEQTACTMVRWHCWATSQTSGHYVFTKQS
jgi:hypothetical protein